MGRCPVVRKIAFGHRQWGYFMHPTIQRLCNTETVTPVSLCLQFTRTFHDFYKWLFLVSHFPFRFRMQSTVFVFVLRSVLSWIANEHVSLDLEKTADHLCFSEGTSTLPGNTGKCSVSETFCGDGCLPHHLCAESIPCEAPLLFFLRTSSRHAAPPPPFQIL